MATLNRELYLIRQVGTEDYNAGYGSYAVPKLYSKNSVNSVVGRQNKEAERHDEFNRQATSAGRGTFKPWPRYEAVPVTIVIGEKL